MTARGLRPLSLLTIVLLAVGYGMAFFYAPIDTDQGFRQKIFYLHVPVAIVALFGFVLGGFHALRYLRTRDPQADLRSYVCIHQSQILALAALVTGAIWGKTAWGAWWRWDEPFLVSFLIIFLLYATYQMIRLQFDEPRRQATAASVFAVTAGVFVPICFGAVRLTTEYLHPRTLDSAATGGLPGSVLATFLLCLVAIAVLYATLVRYEHLSKSLTFRLRALERRATGDELIPQRSSVPQT